MESLVYSGKLNFIIDKDRTKTLSKGCEHLLNTQQRTLPFTFSLFTKMMMDMRNPRKKAILDADLHIQSTIQLNMDNK